MLTSLQGLDHRVVKGARPGRHRAGLSGAPPDGASTAAARGGAVALVLQVADLGAAARASGPHSVFNASSVTVTAAHANGVMLVFENA